MRLAFKIASRFLFSNKSQTILIALGIAIGVSVQVFIGSLIQGLQISLVDKTVGNSSQITIYPGGDKKLIENYEGLVEDITNVNSDILVVSAVADSSGYIKKNEERNPILLRGVNLEDANKIYDFESKLIEGTLPTNKNEIIVGKNLMEEMGLTLNDEVVIQTPSNQTETVVITGFYDLKVTRINETWLITTIDTTQSIFGLDDDITSIEIQVDDVFMADTIASDINTNVLSNQYTVTNWKDLNEELLSGLQGQSISSIMIQVFVLISVVLGIASVLAISVMQKSKQLGILKAMGIKDRQASLIFLFKGLILGVIGAVLGIAIGMGLSFSFTKFAVLEDGSPVVPLYINYKFIVLSGLIAVLSATIAALIPARRSSKLNPIEVIRNG